MQVILKGFHVDIIVIHSHIMENVSEEVNWQSKDSTKHQIEGREPCGLVNSAVVHEGHGLDHLWPFLFRTRRQRPQRVAQGTIEPLCAVVPHGIVGRSV